MDSILRPKSPKEKKIFLAELLIQRQLQTNAVKQRLISIVCRIRSIPDQRGRQTDSFQQQQQQHTIAAHADSSSLEAPGLANFCDCYCVCQIGSLLGGLSFLLIIPVVFEEEELDSTSHRSCKREIIIVAPSSSFGRE